MGVLSSYLRLRIVVVTAFILAVGAVGVLTGGREPLGLLALLALVVSGFAGLVVLSSVR